MGNSMHRDKREWVRDVLARFEGPLVRYAGRITGDLERARDVVQDTFLRLWKAGDELDQTRLAQWLYTVCRNRALDVVRKESRMSAMSAEAAATRRSAEPDPAAVAQKRDTAAVARSLLDGLPTNQQEVIRLKLQHGLSYRQIGEVAGLSVSNVGFLIHTGLKRLRQQMRDLGLTPGAEPPRGPQEQQP
jgi:RNA polymerase sigma-70 factor (ECF subfamily)